MRDLSSYSMLMKRPPKSMRGMRSGVMTSRATGRLPAAHEMKYPEECSAENTMRLKAILDWSDKSNQYQRRRSNSNDHPLTCWAFPQVTKLNPPKLMTTWTMSSTTPHAMKKRSTSSLSPIMK